MFDKIRRLLGAGRTAADAWRPSPSCDIYLRDDAVFVFTGRHTSMGLTTPGEPVFRLPVQPDATELGRAIREALAASAASAATPLDDDGLVSRTTGLRSWTAVERNARRVSVQMREGACQIQSWRPAGGGWEPQTTQPVDEGNAESMGRAALNVAASAAPRRAPPVRHPRGYVRPSNPAGQDVPQPFGYKTWWLVVASSDPRRVADSLKLRDLRACSWAEGYAAANEHFTKLAYVTPSVEGWVLVPYARVPENGQDLRAVLEPLSAEFGEAQAYANVRTSNAYLWARAESGTLIRAFCDADGEVCIDLGTRTDAEVELDVGVRRDGERATREDDVLNVAERWSINPLELGDQETFGTGLLGQK